MVVMVLEKVPVSLRGELTRWLIEPHPGVFVGRQLVEVFGDLVKGDVEVGAGDVSLKGDVHVDQRIIRFLHQRLELGHGEVRMGLAGLVVGTVPTLSVTIPPDSVPPET